MFRYFFSINDEKFTQMDIKLVYESTMPPAFKI